MHAKAQEKRGKRLARPLTLSVTPARINSNETQQCLEFMPLPPAVDGVNAVRRDSCLVPPGEGDLHRRVRVPSPASVLRVGISSPGTAPSFPRRIGGDVSTVQ